MTTLLSQTVTSQFETKVTPNISEKGIGLDANKSYNATVEVIERVYENAHNYNGSKWTIKNTSIDLIITLTTDKGNIGRFGQEFFLEIEAQS